MCEQAQKCKDTNMKNRQIMENTYTEQEIGGDIMWDNNVSYD